MSNNNNMNDDVDYMLHETINEVIEFMKFANATNANPTPKPNSDDEMFKGISVLDDKLLPSYKLNLSQALLEIKKNPKCVPFQIYLERWKYFNDKYKKANKLNEKPKPVINDALLPSTQLTLPIAITQIKNNPQCVPFEAYMKRWNELKITKKHNAMTK